MQLRPTDGCLSLPILVHVNGLDEGAATVRRTYRCHMAMGWLCSSASARARVRISVRYAAVPTTMCKPLLARSLDLYWVLRLLLGVGFVEYAIVVVSGGEREVLYEKENSLRGNYLVPPPRCQPSVLRPSSMPEWAAKIHMCVRAREHC